MKPYGRSIGEAIVAVAVALVFIAIGWSNLLVGGMSMQSRWRPEPPVFVSGSDGMALACATLMLALCILFWMARRRSWPLLMYVLLAFAMAAPPSMYVWLHGY